MCGAIFTTDIDHNTNVNLYTDKESVYLDGGPQNGGSAGLPDGDYYVKVTNPSGSVTLGSSINAPLSNLKAPIHVTAGNFDKYYKIWDIVYQDLDGTIQGYADTPNGCRVYKVWVSSDPDFPHDQTKTDNFRVKKEGSNILPDGAITGYKFEDTNFNGEDNNEPRLPDWQINLYLENDPENQFDSVKTDTNGVFNFDNLPAGHYIVTETLQPGWQQTASIIGIGNTANIIIIDGTFVVDLPENETVSNLGFGNTQNGELIVEKYYDANGNGIYDSSEQLLPNWKISVNGEDDWTKYDKYVLPDSYTVTEYMPLETGWIASDGGPKTVDVDRTQTATVRFGNLCAGPGGGLTLGFWSNKNGQKLFGADDLAAMVSLNLVNSIGSAFNPTTYTLFRNWILSATATNMANMLSAQLAAMELNVLNGKVSDSSLLWLGPNDYMENTVKVKDLISDANDSLANYSLTLSGNTQRAYQEFLKTALDKANNNLNFIQPGPGSYTFN